MTPAEIGQRYDRIAKRWASSDFDRTNGMWQHERALSFLADDQRSRALDIGCGSSGRFVDLLLGHGFDVEGLDVSARMIALARQRHPEVVFHHADICAWDFPYAYDFITAWDSIWHLPLAEQEPVLRKIGAGLAPGGVFIFTTGGVDGMAERWDASMGPEVYYSVLGIPKTLAVLADARCVCRHLEYDQYPELHLFVIAQKLL